MSLPQQNAMNKTENKLKINIQYKPYLKNITKEEVKPKEAKNK